jgi:hypothetical protein
MLELAKAAETGVAGAVDEFLGHVEVTERLVGRDGEELAVDPARLEHARVVVDGLAAGELDAGRLLRDKGMRLAADTEQRLDREEPLVADPHRPQPGRQLRSTAGQIGMEAEGRGSPFAHDRDLPRSEVRELFGREVRFVDLATLIHLKRSAGRPKDLERIAELEALREERDRR